MKRIIALLLAFGMMAGITACGTGSTAAASAPETAETAGMPTAAEPAPVEPAPAPIETPVETATPTSVSEESDEAGVAVESAAPVEILLSEEPALPVIVEVTLRQEDESFVDSAQYSQYEKVVWSDGTELTADATTQTMVLVVDGTVVDLADSDNWVPDAEVYVIDKGQYDTVTMAMNEAKWGPFYFTGVVDFDGGKYQENRSIPAAVKDAEITDGGIAGGEIRIDANYISGIYTYGENGEQYQIKDVTIHSEGLGGNDFGTKGGWGTVITSAGTAQVDVDGVKVYTEGPLHDGIWAGGNSVMDVKNSVVIATENAAAYNFVPYSYDRYLITTAPLTAAEQAEKGLSGEVIEEPYEDMFGSGTKYYYENENYTSNFSAPMLQCVPLALGLYGSMRAACCFGNATMSFTDSLAVSDIWAVLSTDSGRGVLNATDTVAVIGTETDEEKADLTVEVNGEEYYLDTYDSTEGTGYVTYCDGFDDNFYGCKFYAPDYLAIITGGTFDFTASEKGRGYGQSDRAGFMSHGGAYTAVLSHSDFEVADCLFSVMSTGAADITLDDVTVNWTRDHHWGNVLFQFMDTDDVGTGANDLEMDVVDLTRQEYDGNTAAAEGTTKTVTIRNSMLFGNIYNSTGSSNNVSTLDAYDGSSNLLSSWNTSTVNLTLDNTMLDGVISTSYAQHVDASGNPIEGQFFITQDGEPVTGTADNTYDHQTRGRLMNTTAYNGIGRMNVTLTNGAVWNVTGTCIINSLTVGEGCTVNGAVTDNGDGTLTVQPY